MSDPRRFHPQTDAATKIDWPFLLKEMPELPTRVTGEVVICADSQHLYQVLTGFLMLQRAQVIDVTFRVDRNYRPQLPTSHIVELRVHDGPTIAYDMIDGYNFTGPVPLDDYVARVDCYFKRSYNAALHAGVANAGRIVPFGLNYPVTVNHRFFAGLDDNGLLGLPGRAARMIVGAHSLDVTRFEDVPRHRSDPHVLFQTRTWDPAEVAETNNDWRREREQMNEMRATCVRLLRQEFGERFRGGFMPTDHARKHFGDCVLSAATSTKRRYMEIVKESDVCVATAGLHGSNGWSLGEYAAASKAIVAQHLRYDVPVFKEGRHYLGFDAAEECVQCVETLLSDPERLRAMTEENYAYYQRCLRPDRLVMNSLQLALNAGPPRSTGAAS